MELPHDDDKESDDIETYDRLMAEAESLKAIINAIPIKEEINL